MRTIIAIVMFLAVSTTSHAALLDRGNGLIYDDVNHITWAQNASIKGQGISGLMTWAGALAWADSLVYAGYDDWRLPDGHNPDSTITLGFGSLSEMSLLHKMYGVSNATPGPFVNIGPTDPAPGYHVAYWTSTLHPYAWTNALCVWMTDGALVGSMWSDGLNYAWAVRDGDVLPPVATPEPATLLLLGSGAIGMLLRASRRRGASRRPGRACTSR